MSHKERTAEVSWDVFICHAWEDKKDFVRPLVKELLRQEPDLKIWYDEFSLTLGDSLRQKIDYGLANSKFGIVVLSQQFFRKKWPQQELDGLVAREELGRKVILPVWYEISRSEIVQYSPLLADRYAVSNSEGLQIVAGKILGAIEAIEEIKELRKATPKRKNPRYLRIAIAAFVLSSLVGLASWKLWGVINTRLSEYSPTKESTRDASIISGSVPQDDSAKSGRPEFKAPRARVELTEVSGNKSMVDITFVWNDMVSEARGMASVGWGEKLLLTKDPSSNLGQIPWLEIPIRSLPESNLREMRLTGKSFTIKSKKSGRDLTFYPAVLRSTSGSLEAGYYWNAVRVEGNCSLKSGITIKCRFPAGKVKTLVFLQTEEVATEARGIGGRGDLSMPDRLLAEIQGAVSGVEDAQKARETMAVHSDPPVAADHTELEIADLAGTSILLSSPSIAYPGSFGPSNETEGIAVRRGVEESTLLWSGIRILRFRSRQEKNDKDTTVWRHAVEATLADGRVVNVELRDDWNMAYMGGGGTGLLFGRTDLGEVRIPFSTISTLKVLKYARPAKK